MSVLMGCHPVEEPLSTSATPFLNEEIVRVDSMLRTMTLEEKVGQLTVVTGDRPDTVFYRHLLTLAAAGRIGGLLLENWPFLDFAALVDSARRQASLPLLVGTRQRGLLNNQFADAPLLPAAGTLDALSSDKRKARLEGLAVSQLREVGINFWLGSSAVGAGALQGTLSAWLDRLSEERILGIAGLGADATIERSDSLLLSVLQQRSLARLTQRGLAGIAIDSAFLSDRSEAFAQDRFWQCFLDQTMQFQGLSVVEVADSVSLERAWSAGVDLFVVPVEAASLLRMIHGSLAKGRWSQARLDASVRKVLLAKSWMRRPSASEASVSRPLPPTVIQASVADWRGPAPPRRSVTREEIARHFNSDAWRVFSRRLYEEALTVASNPHHFIPLLELEHSFRLLEYSERPFNDFFAAFNKYADGSRHSFRPDAQGMLSSPRSVLGDQDMGILLLDEYQLHEQRDSVLLRDLRDLGREGRLILINFRKPGNLVHFDSTLTVIQLYERNDLNEQLAAQLLFGAVSANGCLPHDINECFRAGTGEPVRQIRLQYAPPETVGIAPEKLVGIDAIARTAIDKGATPGCQVVVAKAGKIIYSKAFGYHAYDKKEAATTDDLYDVASITKVAATTLAAMKLYDEAAFDLQDKLKEHLSCDPESTIGDIPLRKIFTHQSGLQSNMPIAPYIMDRRSDNADCETYFCYEDRDSFHVKVAENFYFNGHYQDSIWQAVQHLPVQPQRGYRYSDVNFMLLQRMIEEKTGSGLDELVDRVFYRPMGLRHIAFNPADRFDRERIVPTQNDTRWRHQLLRGYVHDETAALMGGVGGNAGLFASAEDLATLFQMLLNGGHYGGREYLKPETVKLFTNAGHGNHRGLGFDKPYRTNRTSRAANAPADSFGHTGFTGAAVWVDPDEDLTFVFLSNRVHPRPRNGLLFRLNVRGRIHQVIYDALNTYQEQIPELIADDGP